MAAVTLTLTQLASSAITALRVIARNMHTNFWVIWTYGDKVTLRTRKSGRRGKVFLPMAAVTLTLTQLAPSAIPT